MEIFDHNSNYNFLGARRISIVIAALLMLTSIGLLLTKGLNYSLDFTGGISVEVAYQQSIDVGQVRRTLEKHGFKNPLVQSLGGTRMISIRLQPKEDAHDASATAEAAASSRSAQADTVSRDVLAALKADRPNVTMSSHSFVSSQVGDEVRSSGAIAAVFVIIGIGLYLWIRFERRFAIAALVTEVHDVLVTLGVMALVGREFDLTVLASVLAVIGYSINDKVVVFDRIRELFRLTRNATPEDVLNRSINTTLSRTIITSLFTAITMAALYFFGGSAVDGFAVTMLIGIVVGTLSSIFVASPILLWLGVSKKDLMPVTKENPELARRP